MKELRKKIFAVAHIRETVDLAREYFNNCGLAIESISIENTQKLRDFINKEIHILLADETYHMVKDLYVNKSIRKDKYNNIKLFVDGSYFKKRGAISFYPENDTIIFCSWASGCNRIPFIKGFVNWCEWMKKENKK